MLQRGARVVGTIRPESVGSHRTRPFPFLGDCGSVANHCLAVKRVRTWEPGQHVFKAGDSVRSLYVVRSGAVKNYLTSEDGTEEQVLGFFLPGEVLGLEAIKSRHYCFSAVVLEASSVYELSVQRLETAATNPVEPYDPLAEFYTSAVARDYIALWILSKKAANQRLAAFLLDLAERHAQHGFSACAYRLCMSRRDIGDYLGLALGTVSRLFSEFEANGLLDVHRRDIRLLQIQALRALAGNCPWPD